MYVFSIYVCEFFTIDFLVLQKEEEKLRSQLRKENQQRRIRERSIARGLSASYLEGRNDDDDDTLESSEQSLLALKRRYKKNIAKGILYSCT